MKIANINVDLIDVMGNDISVVNAARVSFDKASDYEYVDLPGGHPASPTSVFNEKDTKLLYYLAKHNHWSPFAHCFASFRVNAPIFVARQLVKHQVGLAWNEVSRRYVDNEPEFYFPATWRQRAENVKQGSSETPAELTNVGTEYMDPRTLCGFALDTYNGLLKDGVAPELARIVLPVNTMTEWIWSGSLMAFARVCKLRLDPHAQAESSVVAKSIKGFLDTYFPHSMNALNQ